MKEAITCYESLPIPGEHEFQNKTVNDQLCDLKKLKTDLETEKSVWLRVSLLAEQALSRFDTSYEEDIELLKQADEYISIDDNTRNCILFRMGEKEILKFLLSLSEQFTFILQQDYATAKKSIVTYKGHCGYESYVRNTVLMLLRKKLPEKRDSE